MSEKRYLTVEELAEKLGRSRRWIFSHLRVPETEVGSIPHYRLPPTPGGSKREGAARFDPEEIDRWIKAGCPAAATLREESTDG